MSVKERSRLGILSRVESGELTLVQAAGLLGVSYRQARRLRRRYHDHGDAGLVHRLRGRPSNRGCDQALRESSVALYREHYSDFGATLACEYLAARHSLVVDDQTLRRWLQSAGLWRRCRKSPPHRRRRERKACFGELVQIDGSHHDWFEGRRAAGPCVLMVMIDDATGWTAAQFFAGETTQAAMVMLRGWALSHGLPRRLYPDRHSIYRVNTKNADEIEARTGRRPPTQFGRAMDELGVKITCAKSPQAKGRVERMNGTLQDRLVKALRVEGIDGLAAANVYLDKTFLPPLNARFAVVPAAATDVHIMVDASRLSAALCEREDRVVSQDQCVMWDCRVFQLQSSVNMAGKRVEVRRGLDGQIQVLRHGTLIRHCALATRPPQTAVEPTLCETLAHHQAPWKPPSHHPWRSGTPSSAGPPGQGHSAPARLRSPTLRDPAPAAVQGTFLMRE